MLPLDFAVEQIWRPAVDEGVVRVGPTGPPEPGWTERESYWLFPTAATASLLLPRGPRAVTAAAATNYRGLRRPHKNVGRVALGGLARAGLPVSRDRASVRVRDDVADPDAVLPLGVLARALGRDGRDDQRLYAATGVRRGANRKATLHLLAADGTPVGYAKLGWNDVTDEFVATESAALAAVGGRPGPMRAPALLADADWHGHRVIVTEPLPLDVRGARSKRTAPPTPGELYSLCPVVRRAPLADSAHLRGLADRLRALVDEPVGGPVARLGVDLLDRLLERPGDVPLTERWHGDLTPWNRARDSSGQLWVWDWESSEPDAVAGLDALHWAFSVRRPPTGGPTEVRLPDCQDDAAEALRAAGVPRDRWADVSAVYALTVIERAAALAGRSGGWERLWIGVDDLETLAAQARDGLAA